MALSFNPNLWPDGGWFFKDADGVKHVASSFPALINTVTEYRKRRSQPPGDVEQEITVQLCGRNRGFCKDTNPGPIPEMPSPTLHQKVLDYLTTMTQEKRLKRLKRVSDDVARQRAEVCARCPRQRAHPSTCGGCLQSIANSRKALLDGQDPVHAGIQTCSVLQEDAATMVHFDVGRRNDPGLPPQCWRRDGN